MRSVLRNEMYDERLSNFLIEVATEGRGATLQWLRPGLGDEHRLKAPKGSGSQGKQEVGRQEEGCREAGSEGGGDNATEGDLPAGSVAGSGESECAGGISRSRATPRR